MPFFTQSFCVHLRSCSCIITVEHTGIAITTLLSAFTACTLLLLTAGLGPLGASRAGRLLLGAWLGTAPGSMTGWGAGRGVCAAREPPPSDRIARRLVDSLSRGGMRACVEHGGVHACMRRGRTHACMRRGVRCADQLDVESHTVRGLALIRR